MDALAWHAHMVQRIHDKGGVDVVADLADQCDLAVKFGHAYGLVGAFSTHRSGGIQNFCGFSCLWKEIYIKGHIGINTPHNDKLF